MQTHADDGVWTEMVESVTLAKFRLEEAWKVQLKTVRLQGYKATRCLDLGSASDTCTNPHPEITPITAGSSVYLGINTPVTHAGRDFTQTQAGEHLTGGSC
jgi:hypothetical protein